MEIEGRIILDLPLQEGVSKAGNPWKKKEWVMETTNQGQYPRKVKFTLFGDRADSVHIELGKSYVVSVDVESREFNGRWFTDVNAYAARESAGQMPPAAPGYGAPGAPAYGAPAQPGYGVPGAGYGAPAAPGYGTPATPAAPFGAPAPAPAPAAPAAAPYPAPGTADFGAGNDSDDLPF